jgi:hypothetical protein
MSTKKTEYHLEMIGTFWSIANHHIGSFIKNGKLEMALS